MANRPVADAAAGSAPVAPNFAAPAALETEATGRQVDVDRGPFESLLRTDDDLGNTRGNRAVPEERMAHPIEDGGDGRKINRDFVGQAVDDRHRRSSPEMSG